MRLGILGPLLVAGDDGNPVTVAAPRQRTLLAALLARPNRTVPVAELAELVWDAAPPGGAARTVRSYVVRLRRAVGPEVASRIVTRDPGYRCEVTEDELDVLRFEALCRQGGTAVRAREWRQAHGLLTEALGLWRGAPLENVASQALHQQCAEHLEQARLRAVEWRIEADLHLGRHEELIPELRALSDQYPLREHGHAQLMLALYRCGRAAEALEAFQRARRVLVTELGIEPGPALRALQEKILAADPGLTAPQPQDESAAATGHAPLVVPRQLPPAVGHFTGRAEELRTLSELSARTGLAGGTVVISAIGGMGGVGKTALALQWAHQVARRFPDGQLYVNLRGFDPSGEPMAAHEAVRNFLDGLGIPAERIPRDPQAQAALYRSLLADKKMLIVLDNARDEQQVRPLLPASPASLVLVTSRNQLAGLAAADGARLLSLGVLSPGEAVQLLSARLGTARAGIEPEAVGEIARLCACLPLALSVTAARAAARPRFPLAALAAELRDTPARLDALDAGDPTASVRAVFSWSYQQLGSAAARMFRLLGLHPGPDIGILAAASLAAVDEPQARRLLRELARDCLITEHAPGRFACHDLLRAYAAGMARDCDSQPDRDATIRRVLDHYLHTAGHAALLLRPAREPVALAPPSPGTRFERPADHRQALAWFKAEHQVLLAAVTLAAETGADSHAWQLPCAMTEYLYRRGYMRERVTVMGAALAAATRLDDALGQAVSLRRLGNACTNTGDYDQARAHLERCLPLYRRLGDRMGQAWAHQNLSVLAEVQGRYADALAHNEQALGLFQAIGHEAGEAETLGKVAWFNALLGDYQRAQASCEQSFAFIARLGDRHFECDVWDTLGYIELHLGNLARAAAHFEVALGLCRDHGNRYTEAAILAHIGSARHAAGEVPQACQVWEQALAIYDDLRHPDAAKVRAKLARLCATGTCRDTQRNG